MSSEDMVISVRNLTKRYRLFSHPGDRIKQFASLGLKQYHHEFTALENVSFDVRRGETVGIIGRNGSGKSTLLQLICGILKPTAGSVNVKGRISALLELGAGFNPEFTGRENVYFQGALTGFTQEQMNERFSSIAAFADIGEFIDQPVRTYSSGMFMRLAFSVAISMEPDVLVVDEALTVGDMAFQLKCRSCIQAMTDKGTSLLLVSHDKNLVTSTCNRAILLDNGRDVADDRPSNVFDYFYALMVAKKQDEIIKTQIEGGKARLRSGSGEARVKTVRLADIDGRDVAGVEVGQKIAIEIDVAVYEPIPKLVLALAIRDRLGQTVFATTTSNLGQSLLDVAEGSAYKFKFSLNALMGEGAYSVSLFLVSTNDRLENNYDTYESALAFEVHNTTHEVFAGNVWLSPNLEILSSGQNKSSALENRNE